MHEKHVQPDPDPDSENEPVDKNEANNKEDNSANESGESDDDPCPYFDVSTDEACARLMSRTLPESRAPEHCKSQVLSTTSNVDASARLAKFRPIYESIETLRALLEARADPNIIIGHGQLSPLRNVYCFAHLNDVSPMRELLLKHGATESEDDKKRWEKRERANIYEKPWLKNFHKDERA